MEWTDYWMWSGATVGGCVKSKNLNFIQIFTFCKELFFKCFCIINFSNLWTVGSYKGLTTEDYADFRPARISPADTALQAVDVFFIHPTGYFLGKLWNDPIDLSSGTSKKTDKLMANNASIFNDCLVYAPRYRQATIITFLNMEGANEQQALALAYQDVKQAFIYFLENYNHGRSFILAGHSQGSYHGKIQSLATTAPSEVTAVQIDHQQLIGLLADRALKRV